VKNPLKRWWLRLSGVPERQAHSKLLQAAQLALVNMALVAFAKEIAAQAVKGQGLQQDELARIKANCIARMHDYGAAGLSIQDEAFVLNGAIKIFRTHLDGI
jgi:hypothetical protein